MGNTPHIWYIGSGILALQPEAIPSYTSNCNPFCNKASIRRISTSLLIYSNSETLSLILVENRGPHCHVYLGSVMFAWVPQVVTQIPGGDPNAHVLYVHVVYGLYSQTLRLQLLTN